ncbi:MAG: hypothetical protein V3S32_09530 [Acidimicrobiia bacterium]
MNSQRRAWLVTLAAFVISACTGGTSITRLDPVETDEPAATSAPTTVSTQTTAVASRSTTEVTPQSFAYAVVGEERERRLAVLDPADPCLSEENPCSLSPLFAIELPASPHNLTAHGSVVYATHPGAGTVSRVDIATGEVTTTAVGVEPHDVKFSTADALLYVTDEEGQQLLTLDPDTLETVGVKDLPARPHDLAIAGEAIWITMIGIDELGKISGGKLELFSTGKRPHDLIVDTAGLVWFSNWGSAELSVFDPTDGTTARAPAGVVEPHHFALGPTGEVWVSDNGGSAIVRFGSTPTSVDVGPVPHHLAVTGDIVVVAVSGLGKAVFVSNDAIVGTATLTQGLHGVAIVNLQTPPTP